MSTSYFQNWGSFIRDCNGTTLLYDQACLQIIADETISFWSQYDECEGCILQETRKKEGTEAYVLDTLSPVHYAVRNETGQICNGTYEFGEYGQYTIDVIVTADCKPRMTAEPNAASLPLLTAAVVLLAMATLWYVVKGIGKRFVAGRLYARYFAREDNELGSERRVSTAEASVPRSQTRARLRSLDIFRGIAVAVMIFVNAGGGGYQIFSHSVWNGITVADMVFPWFAFAMGAALVLSLNARLRTAMPRITAFKQVARRALIMTFIGIILEAVKARVPGVLSRLAFMYLVVGALECAFMRPTITPGPSTLFRDIAAGWQQWLVTLLIFAIPMCVTLLVPAPGCPRGYTGPGGLHLSAYGMDLRNCTGGIAGYIDRPIFGASHEVTNDTVPWECRREHQFVYRTTVTDGAALGLLASLSGPLLVQSGAHASRIMLVYNHARSRIMRWVFWSIIFGVTGGALCMFSKNGGPIPMNRRLWSVSYCLVCASTAFFAQAVLYFIVDLKNKWGGRPLYYAGQNALFLFVSSNILNPYLPLSWNNMGIIAPTHSQLLAAHVGVVLVWLAMAAVLHRKRIFIAL